MNKNIIDSIREEMLKVMPFSGWSKEEILNKFNNSKIEIKVFEDNKRIYSSYIPVNNSQEVDK